MEKHYLDNMLKLLKEFYSSEKVIAVVRKPQPFKVGDRVVHKTQGGIFEITDISPNKHYLDLKNWEGVISTGWYALDFELNQLGAASKEPHKCHCDFVKTILVSGCICGGE